MDVTAIAESLCDLFFSYESGFYWYYPDKPEGKNYQHVRREVTPNDWIEHLNGDRGLSLVPLLKNDTVRWSAFDFDFAIEPQTVAKDLQEYPLAITRSKRGRAHGYLFFNDELLARVVRERMQALIETFPPNYDKRKIEIFPKQVKRTPGTEANGLNMPFFDAFGDNERYAFDHRLGKVDLPTFIEGARKTRDNLTWEAFIDFEPAFFDGPVCLQKLLWANGGNIPDGSRSDALFAAAVYFRRKGEDWKEKLEHFNQRRVDPPVTDLELNNIVKGHERKNYAYNCDRWTSICEKTKCAKRRFGVAGHGVLMAQQRGVTFGDHIEKILTDPPIYRIPINGEWVEMEYEDMITNRLFFKHVSHKFNGRIFLPVSKPDWEEVLHHLESLPIKTIEEPIPSEKAYAWDIVRKYLCGDVYAFGKDPGDLANGNPYIHELKGIPFLLFDFQCLRDLLQKEKQVQGLSTTDLSRLLRQYGAQDKKTIRYKEKSISCWGFPESAYSAWPEFNHRSAADDE